MCLRQWYSIWNFSPVFCVLQQWLECMPELEETGFDFWGKLKTNINTELKREEEKLEVCFSPPETIHHICRDINSNHGFK